MSAFVKTKLVPSSPQAMRLALLAMALSYATICSAQFAGNGGNIVDSSAMQSAMQRRIGGVPAGANVSAAAAANAQSAMMMRYDLNRDGQLSAQETMYAMKRRGGVQNGYGGMGNAGQGMAQPMNQAGNQAVNNQPVADPDDAALQARKANAAAKKKPAKKSLVAKYDKDGDGKLNAEEKAAATAAISKRQK